MEKTEKAKYQPKFRYRPGKDGKYESILLESAEDEKDLGPGWYTSPADFGIETCPGRRPDPNIAKKRVAFEASQKKQGA